MQRIFRFSPDVKVIQIDISAEELHNSVHSEVAIQSDLKPAVAELGTRLREKQFVFASREEWWSSLRKKSEDNRRTVEVTIAKAV